MKTGLLSLIQICLISCLLVACGGRQMDASQVTAATLTDLTTVNLDTIVGEDYRIGAQDKLNVRVFQVEDLSFDEIVVDSSGSLQMPLIGAVRAAGLTPAELSRELAARLGERYLRNPQVTVSVIEAASQKVTVDGAVTKPGVYVMRGRTSLLQAVAMAEGPTQIADLTKVAVFRTINGERNVALFDLEAIRQGRAQDPEVFGDDIVVVDTSRLNSTVRNLVTALPALAIFQVLR